MIRGNVSQVGVRGNILPITLAAGVIVAFTAILSTLLIPAADSPTHMHLTSNHEELVVGETFVIAVTVASDVPINVFAGEVRFDPLLLHVKNIEYNTSIADLWVEYPWYSNGEGTLNFGGGTTVSGGFTGDGTLITITFETKGIGTSDISIHKPRILLHDGLGTDTAVHTTFDSIVTTADDAANLTTHDVSESASIKIRRAPSLTDLNGDEKTSIADVSIFMLHLISGDLRSDFNGSGSIDTADLSILLESQ